MGTELKELNNLKQQFRIWAITAQYNIVRQQSKNKLLVKNLKKRKKIGDEVRKRLSVQMMNIGRLTKKSKDDSRKIVSIEKSKRILADNVKAAGEELAEANAC